MIRTVPDLPIEPPEDVVSDHCDYCKGEIYEGDVYYDIDGKSICPDCLGRFSRRYFLDCARRAR